jgi:5-methylcytosine-specific restriction protein A
MNRTPVEATPRKGFTKAQRARAFMEANGLCALCGDKIIGAWDIDHRIELALGGKHEPSNWRIAHKSCHRQRTSERAPVLAKVKRILRREAGETRTKRPIPNRPFNKTLRRRFDGTVERRDA